MSKSSNISRILAFCAVLLTASGAQASPGKPAPKQGSKPQANKQPATKPASSGHVSGALNGAYTAYISRLRAKLDNKWYLADGRNRVTLAVTVDPNGSVTDLKLSSTPANPQAEQAASDAFNQSQPLEVLPGGSSAIKLTLVFESLADPHGDNNRSISGQIDQIVQQQTPPADKDKDKESTEAK